MRARRVKEKSRRRQRGSASPKIPDSAGVVAPVIRIPATPRCIIGRCGWIVGRRRVIPVAVAVAVSIRIAIRPRAGSTAKRESTQAEADCSTGADSTPAAVVLRISDPRRRAGSRYECRRDRQAQAAALGEIHYPHSVLQNDFDHSNPEAGFQTMNEPSPTSLPRLRSTAPECPYRTGLDCLRCTECGARDADFVVSGNCVSIFWPESSSEHMPEIPMLIWYKERVGNGAKAEEYFGVRA